MRPLDVELMPTEADDSLSEGRRNEEMKQSIMSNRECHLRALVLHERQVRAASCLLLCVGHRQVEGQVRRWVTRLQEKCIQNKGGLISKHIIE